MLVEVTGVVEVRARAAGSERGTHEQLLATGGRYRQLYDKQYRLERDRFINPGEDFTPEPEAVAAPARVSNTL
mgnify:CR=1 FL=1